FLLKMKLLVRIFFFLFAAFGSIAIAYADGSRDLYYPGVNGYRAYLVSRPVMYNNNTLYNQATHYVYARAGETIAVASSAQGIGRGRMVLTAPNGATYDTERSPLGKIPNRQAELDGPKLGTNGGYDAYKR